MGEFKVEEGIKIPPPDAYFLDLVWIEYSEKGEFGPSYRWHWVIADIPSQKEYAGSSCSMITAAVPTVGNNFGRTLAILQGGIELGQTGSTEELAMAKYRVKGSIKHKKNKDEGKPPHRNVSELFEGTAKKGEGIGPEGAYPKLKEKINVYLASRGQPLLEIKEEEKASTAGAKASTVRPKTDVDW